MSWALTKELPFKRFRRAKDRTHAASYLEVPVGDLHGSTWADFAPVGFAVVWRDPNTTGELWRCAVVVGDVERRTAWRSMAVAQRMAFEQVARTLKRCELVTWSES